MKILLNEEFPSRKSIDNYNSNELDLEGLMTRHSITTENSVLSNYNHFIKNNKSLSKRHLNRLTVLNFYN